MNAATLAERIPPVRFRRLRPFHWAMPAAICSAMLVRPLCAGEFFPDDPPPHASRSQTTVSPPRPLLLPGDDAGRKVTTGRSRQFPVGFQTKQPARDLKQVYDSEFRPKPIGELTADISEPELPPEQPKGKPPAKAKEKVKIKFTKAPERGAYKTDPYATAVVLRLNRPDGGWIDQTLSGPVAPFCYLPLYFEDASLERFGETHGLLCQSLLSTADFAVRVPLLPYMMTVQPPCRHVLPNYNQPPSRFSAKLRCYASSIDARGVAVEAAAAAALIIIIP